MKKRIIAISILIVVSLLVALPNIVNNDTTNAPYQQNVILATPTTTTLYPNGLIVSQSNVTIQNIEVANPNGVCLQITGSNVTVRNVYVHDCKDHGILVSSQNVTIEDSVVTMAVNRGLSCSSSTQWGSGIKGYIGAVNLNVNRVNVYNICGEGIAFTRVVGGSITNSTVWDAFSVNYYIDNSYNILVEGNLSTNTNNATYKRDGNTARGIALGKEYYSGWGGQLHDITVRRNVVYNAIDGIRVFQAMSGVTPSGCINCLFEYNSVVKGAQSTGRSLQIYGDSTNSNVIGRYNILYSSPYANFMTGVSFVDNYVGSPFSGFAWNNYASFTAQTPICNYGAIPCIETFTPSATIPVTDTYTPTITPTPTITFTPSVTPTGTIFPSDTPTITPTSTKTSTPTFTPTPSPVPTFCEETEHFRICTK